MTNKRNIYIDALRILAICFVLFNHTGTYGYMVFTFKQDSPYFGVYLFCSILCKVAVPVFLMISGALLLKKEESISDVFKRRILKYASVLVFASLIMYIYLAGPEYSNISVGDFLLKLYSTNISTAFWYFYSYLGFLVTLPLLRKLSKNMGEREYLYMLGIYFAFALTSILEYLIGHNIVKYNANFTVFVTSNIVFYPLIGDFLANKIKIEDLTLKRLLLVCIIGILAVVSSCYLTCNWCNYIGEWKESSCQTFFNTLVFLPAIAIFLIFRFVFNRSILPQKVQKCITNIGSCTFGIFLFERILRDKTKVVYETLVFTYDVNRFAACFVWVLCAGILGTVITILLKKLPLLRKIL